MSKYNSEWMLKTLINEKDRFIKTSRFFVSLQKKINNNEFADSEMSNNELLNILSPSFYMDAQITLEFLITVIYQRFIGTTKEDRKTEYIKKYNSIKKHIHGIKQSDIDTIRAMGNSIKHTLKYNGVWYGSKKVINIIKNAYEETIKSLNKDN